MRRLPIYFLIDVSESMVGDQIELVQQGMAEIIQELKTDPTALETVWVSILVFAGQAKTLVPLQDIISFYPPKFPIGGGTSLGNGLGHLMYELRKNEVKTTPTQKGDWKPLIFLFTDGVPTDSSEKAIIEWESNWKRSTNLVAISLGENAEFSLLNRLTHNVLKLEDTGPSGYKDFFKWVTASIKTSSESLDTSSGFELAGTENTNLKEIDLSKDGSKVQADDNSVVLTAKCQNTHKTYLMKYNKSVNPSNIEGLELSTKSYRLKGAYPVDETYEELSDKNKAKLSINTEELIGVPTCPSCGNQTAFAVCQCGQIHCIGDEEISSCPGCGNKGKYGAGSGGFDVTRTQG
jgi:uncharacterized protein YegL